MLAQVEHHDGGLEDHAMQPNEQDLKDQMLTLMNEPFVQCIKDFFFLTLEKFKHDQDKRAEFLALCRTFDQSYVDLTLFDSNRVSALNLELVVRC